MNCKLLAGSFLLDSLCFIEREREERDEILFISGCAIFTNILKKGIGAITGTVYHSI
jgi:hypothetical protein